MGSYNLMQTKPSLLIGGYLTISCSSKRAWSDRLSWLIESPILWDTHPRHIDITADLFHVSMITPWAKVFRWALQPHAGQAIHWFSVRKLDCSFWVLKGAWSVLADWNLNPLWDTHPRHIDITADLFHVSMMASSTLGQSSDGPYNLMQTKPSLLIGGYLTIIGSSRRAWSDLGWLKVNPLWDTHPRHIDHHCWTMVHVSMMASSTLGQSSDGPYNLMQAKPSLLMIGLWLSVVVLGGLGLSWLIESQSIVRYTSQTHWYHCWLVPCVHDNTLGKSLQMGPTTSCRPSYPLIFSEKGEAWFWNWKGLVQGLADNETSIHCEIHIPDTLISLLTCSMWSMMISPWAKDFRWAPTTSCSPSHHSWLRGLWLSVVVLGGLSLILADWKSIHCEIHIPDTLISLLDYVPCVYDGIKHLGTVFRWAPTTSCSPSNHSWLGATWLSVVVLGGLGLILADWKSIHCEIHIPDTLISLLAYSMCPMASSKSLGMAPQPHAAMGSLLMRVPDCEWEY